MVEYPCRVPTLDFAAWKINRTVPRTRSREASQQRLHFQQQRPHQETKGARVGSAIRLAQPAYRQDTDALCLRLPQPRRIYHIDWETCGILRFRQLARAYRTPYLTADACSVAAGIYIFVYCGEAVLASIIDQTIQKSKIQLLLVCVFLACRGSHGVGTFTVPIPTGWLSAPVAWT
jgi:hypothetical protein